MLFPAAFRSARSLPPMPPQGFTGALISRPCLPQKGDQRFVRCPLRPAADHDHHRRDRIDVSPWPIPAPGAGCGHPVFAVCFCRWHGPDGVGAGAGHPGTGHAVRRGRIGHAGRIPEHAGSPDRARFWPAAVQPCPSAVSVFHAGQFRSCRLVARGRSDPCTIVSAGRHSLDHCRADRMAGRGPSVAGRGPGSRAGSRAVARRIDCIGRARRFGRGDGGRGQCLVGDFC